MNEILHLRTLYVLSAPLISMKRNLHFFFNQKQKLKTLRSFYRPRHNAFVERPVLLYVDVGQTIDTRKTGRKFGIVAALLWQERRFDTVLRCIPAYYGQGMVRHRSMANWQIHDGKSETNISVVCVVCGAKLNFFSFLFRNSQLVRRVTRQVFVVLHRNKWDRKLIKQLNEHVEKSILDKSTSIGFLMHYTEIFLDELAKVKMFLLCLTIITTAEHWQTLLATAFVLKGMNEGLLVTNATCKDNSVVLLAMHGLLLTLRLFILQQFEIGFVEHRL